MSKKKLPARRLLAVRRKMMDKNRARKLSDKQAHQVDRMLDEGSSIDMAAKIMGVHRSTISRLKQGLTHKKATGRKVRK